MQRLLTGSIAPALALAASLAAGAARAQDTTANEGGDVAFGGPGSGPGQFLELRDLTFDSKGNGYALDGAQTNAQTKAREGNLRVQKFDAGGKLLGASSIAEDALGDKQDPQRIAALGDGTVFITQPAAGVVQVLGPDGKLRRDVPLPRAMAITVWNSGAGAQGAGAQGERIAVVPSRREIVDNHWTWLDGDRIVILTSTGEVERTIALEKKLEGVQDITADRAGSFYIQAEPNAIYKISPQGKTLQTFGGNPTTRNSDGSEVLHTVAVDSRGNVYTMAWGNPGVVTRFDADGARVTQRDGQFKWADPWSVHSEYTPLAIDPSDRLWAASTHRFEASYVHMKTQRAAPAIVRARADFFEAPANSIKHTPIRMLGFKPAISCGLPYNIAYEARKPIPMAISVAPANRSVSAVLASWTVSDAWNKEIARGQARMPLQNGAEAKANFSFTPPRLGYYFVRCAFESGGQPMGALGEHVGATARWANVPILSEGESKGGWTDAPRQMWSGLPNMRIHPARDEAGLKETDAQIEGAEKAGATFFLQLVDNMSNLTPEHVRRVVTRYKGRVKYYEVCNEPNFSSDPDKYFAGHKMAYQIIHEVDPQAQVMGPGTVNIDLNWLKRLYELGFKSASDIVSLHDYEGHESITPEHWAYKFHAVRAIMAANGDGSKPIWQTERAISGVRGNNFQGLAQAIRTTLHRDLLESLGIPSEHNNHYYLNQGGYSDVPTYVWSANGPHPAALALRTRHALTSALGRKYLGSLDFGPIGSSFLMGTRYGGASGETIVLRNLGTRATPVDFELRGATALDVVDCWGNVLASRVANGRASLSLEQMPMYVRLPAGASLSPLKLDFGRNVAERAAWRYSSASKSEAALLSNGVYETYHSGDPQGDTNGDKIWSGDLPLDASGQAIPQTLEALFGRPQAVNKVIVHGVRGDNQFCALLDYDLDYYDGREWKSIQKVRSQMPPSQEAASADATHAIWMDDTNLYVHRFATVQAERIRIVARRASFGFIPDDKAKAWGTTIAPKLMLRELEIFAPTLPVTLAARVGSASTSTSTSTASTALPSLAAGAPLTVEVKNNGRQALRGTLQAFAPDGWKAAGAQKVDVAPGKSQTLRFALSRAGLAKVGRSFFDVELRDAKNKVVASSYAGLETPAPVEATPVPAVSVAAGASRFAIDIKNITGAPVSGVASLVLMTRRELNPVEVPFGPIEPGQSKRVAFEMPGVAIEGGRYQAFYDVQAGGTQMEIVQAGGSQRWSILGPFARDWARDFGPESGVDLSKSSLDAMGNERKWLQASAGADGMVNLADALKPGGEATAYAVAYVDSPLATAALLSVGTDDGGKGWLNGKPIYQDDGSHAASPGQQKIPVQLKAGRNEVLLKVTQGEGGWGFYFDLLDPQTGQPLRDVIYSPTPR